MSRPPQTGAAREWTRSGPQPPCANTTPGGSAILCDHAWSAIAASLGLSKRQVQIVRVLFDDATEPAMAETLGISSHTVHTHLERVHKKLGVHSRVELVVLVLDEFLRLTASGEGGLPPVCVRHAQGNCPLERERRESGPSPE